MGIDSGPSPEESQLNEAAALAALDGQRELLADLAAMFREDACELLASLEAALSNEHRADARRCAHSLKGLASTFYAGRTMELAQTIEDRAGNESVPLSEIAQLPEVAELKRSTQLLIVELQQAGYLS